MASDELDADESEDLPTVLGKAPAELILGFLSCPTLNSNFVGAVLVTDSRGRPLDFAFVEPIRPSTMQKLLYGKTLDEHVRIDVIARKLLQGNSVRPDVVFVDTENLLVIRRIVDVPVAWLNSNDGSDTDDLSTLTYRTNEAHDDEAVVGQLLSQLEGQVDFIEPFSRVTEALKEALKTTQGKQSQ